MSPGTRCMQMKTMNETPIKTGMAPNSRRAMYPAIPSCLLSRVDVRVVNKLVEGNHCY